MDILTSLENPNLITQTRSSNTTIIILQYRTSILVEEDNRYLQVEYKAMRLKIADDEEGDVNPKPENVTAKFIERLVEIIKEPIKVELAQEDEFNSLHNTKDELKKDWVEVVKGKVKIEIEAK